MKNRIILALAVLSFSILLYEGCSHKESTYTPGTQDIENNRKTETNDKTVLTPKTESSGVLKDITNLSGDRTQLNNDDMFNTPDKRLIIRSGTMSIEVDKYDETEGKIRDIVKKYNAYITNTSATLNPGGKKQGTITIRIPSEKFDGLLDELRKSGKEMNENISGKDVTEEYMDSEARLKTQRQLEERLLKLLDEKTAKLTDIVDVEQKLSGVRENIEKTEGRMKYLKDQAAYSTIAVSVYEPSLLQTSTGGGFFYELEQGIKRGLNGFTVILSGIITFIIAILPIAVPAYLIIYLLIRYFKKRKRTNQQVSTAPAAK
jgi:hypothetical protein